MLGRDETQVPPAEIFGSGYNRKCMFFGVGNLARVGGGNGQNKALDTLLTPYCRIAGKGEAVF
jgi:hypothetical protein